MINFTKSLAQDKNIRFLRLDILIPVFQGKIAVTLEKGSRL